MSWGDVLGTSSTPAAAPKSSGWASVLTPAGSSKATPAPTPVASNIASMINAAAPGIGGTKTTTAPTGSGMDTGALLASIAQGFARDAAQVGISVGNLIKPSTVGTSIPTSDFKIGGVDVGSTLFGKEPLTGLADTAARYEATLKQFGLGKFSTPLAVAGAVLPPALDVTGFGIGEKAIASGGVKAVEGTAPKVVAGINTELPRHLLVSGDSVETKIPFANDYREAAPIELGKVPKKADGLPIIKADAPKPKGEFTYEPIKQEVTAPKTPVKAPGAPVSAPIRPVAATERAAVESVAGTKASGLARDIEAKAIENDLIQHSKGLATYEARTIKDQAEKIANIIDKTPEDIGPILRSEKMVPDGVSPSYFVQAMDRYATRTGNSEILQDLMSSRLTGEGSQHASELRMLGERDQSSAMKALKEIEVSRAPKAEKMVKQATKQVRVEKAKLNNPKVWSDFVKQITC